MRQIILIMTLAASSFADRFEWNTYYFEDDRDNSVYTSSFSFLKTLWKSTRLVFDAELDQVTIAPIIEPTNDSNKSAPIPATSPTLSPTLSAIVAGFKG